MSTSPFFLFSFFGGSITVECSKDLLVGLKKHFPLRSVGLVRYVDDIIHYIVEILKLMTQRLTGIHMVLVLLTIVAELEHL